MNEEKIKVILDIYRQQVENTREALRVAGVPEQLVIFHTLNMPDFPKLIPEDMVRFYQEVKVAVVLALKKIGFSEREIATRLGGHTLNQVHRILHPEVTSQDKKHEHDTGEEDTSASS